MVLVEVVGMWSGGALEVISVTPRPDAHGIAPAITSRAREAAVMMTEDEARVQAGKGKRAFPAEFRMKCYLPDKLFMEASA